ncbi:hypothetical protein K437DRAFT_274544, partial [Tilletiaria anomala UBC 951]
SDHCVRCYPQLEKLSEQPERRVRGIRQLLKAQSRPYAPFRRKREPTLIDQFHAAASRRREAYVSPPARKTSSSSKQPATPASALPSLLISGA